MNTSDSLEDRILRWAATDTSDLPDFPDDKSDLPSDFEYNPEDYEDDEEEVIEEMSELELLKYLGQQETLSEAEQQLFSQLNTTPESLQQQQQQQGDPILNQDLDINLKKAMARLTLKSDTNSNLE
ncbi:hypothetical protein BD770DRAFT_395479 [Pilaira anomala]|nr:hypothetical protein BD770DRAFT_395479 [Pilaira anomala]